MHSKPLKLASSEGEATADVEALEQPVVPGRDTALREALQLIERFMRDPAVTEVCINQPGEVFTESNFGWERHEVPEVTLAWCRKLARLIATFSAQTVNEKNPILSGVLPDGERVQVVVPPAVEVGHLSVTIRKPSLTTKTPEEFERDGLTDEVIDQLDELAPHEQKLLQLKKDRDFWAFFRLAVETKQNIVIAGATGSGKTTFGKSIVKFIPRHERLITIEDVREMYLEHPNRVHLLYSEGGQGTTEVSAKTLLQSCLRMKPDRILLAEIRSKVAYDYIVNVSSGHPGAITTVHAGSCGEAFEMLMLRVKESEEGRELSRDDILGLLRAKIDVVIQFKVFDRIGEDGRVRKVRRITEIYYDPSAKRKPLV